jgi:hypothetical protein
MRSDQAVGLEIAKNLYQNNFRLSAQTSGKLRRELSSLRRRSRTRCARYSAISVAVSTNRTCRNGFAFGRSRTTGCQHWSWWAPRAQRGRTWRGCGGFRSLPASTTGKLAPCGVTGNGRPLAHTRPTLRPSVARRLVLPGLGYGATGAPVLARSICEALGELWGNSGVHTWVNSGKDG